MQIDWWTLVLQGINFLVLVWLLWRFLYRPVREVIEKRRELAEQAFAQADQEKQEAEAARQRFEDDREKLGQERQDMLKKIHDELEAERGKVLEAARQQADKLIESAHGAIAGEREAALTEIREQTAELAAELAADLLRKAGAEAESMVFLDRLEQQLKALPAEERDRLERDLSADDARLTVVTAAPLKPKDRDQWVKRLSACLGRNDKTEFATDPAILGGAELRFPHAVLKFTWADQLRKAKDVLRKNEAAS